VFTGLQGGGDDRDVRGVDGEVDDGIDGGVGEGGFEGGIGAASVIAGEELGSGGVDVVAPGDADLG